MPRGGARVGAGRKTGSTDAKFGKVSAKRVLDRTGTGPDAMPLAYLLGVMNSKDQPSNIRLQAAIAAAPYCHPRLASVEVKSDTVTTLSVESDLGKALRELAEIARLREIGPVIEGEILEPATMEQPDIMPAGHYAEPDIMTGQDDDETAEN